MNILVIGSGGREHALVSKLNTSPLVNHIDVIPGNDAMSQIADIHKDIAESDHQQILKFAQAHQIEWIIIGPEQPLIDGLSDLLRQHGFKVFGPNQDAAQIEGSLFAKAIICAIKSLSKCASNTCASGSPKRALNSITFGPSEVSIAPI